MSVEKVLSDILIFIRGGTPGHKGTLSATVNAAATTNATLVLAGAVVITKINLFNNDGANPAYFKIYDKATAPVVGTDVPKWTLTLPIIGGFSDDLRYELVNGFAYAITLGKAVTDATAVAADQVQGVVGYAQDQSS